MSDVCPKTVWIMSKVWSTTYVCSKPGVQKLKSEVQSMSKVQNPSLKPKSEVCQLSKVWNQSPESNAQNSKFEVESLKSEVETKVYLKSSSKFFAIIITLSYNTGIIYCVFVDQLWQ